MRNTTKRGRDSRKSRPHLHFGRQSPAAGGIITLLTDFGSQDYFVAAMKGVILSRAPLASIVDITHEIPPQDIETAAFTIFTTYQSFPKETVHVCVVDPGVGSERRALLLETAGQYFIGPDNGIFSYVCDRETARHVFVLDELKVAGAQPISKTFHGRDVFAPAGALLAQGIKPKELGSETSQYVQLGPLEAQQLPDGQLKGRIIHIDRFGNCITNITRDQVPDTHFRSNTASNLDFILIVGKTRITSFRNFFAEPGGKVNQVFAFWGSAGFLELGLQNRSAASALKAKRGIPVLLRF